MSVICIQKDFVRCDGIVVYHRALAFIYTRLGRRAICDYLGQMELCANDRQKTFFKIDVEILAAPSELNLKDWYIVMIILKSEHEFSMNLIVNLICERYPHPLQFNRYDTKEGRILCSGTLVGDKIPPADVEAYKKLSNFYALMQKNVVSASNDFREMIIGNKDHAIDVLVELAERYKIYSGHWMLLFHRKLKDSDKEKIMDYILYCFSCNPTMVKNCVRFTAKISKEHLCLGLGVSFTNAAIDSRIMQRAGCALAAMDLTNSSPLVDLDRNGPDADSIPVPKCGAGDCKKEIRPRNSGFGEATTSWRKGYDKDTVTRSTKVLVNLGDPQSNWNCADDGDPTVTTLRQAIENIYKPRILGTLQIRFKLDIVSHCCIQRNNRVVRPTIYGYIYERPPRRNNGPPTTSNRTWARAKQRAFLSRGS